MRPIPVVPPMLLQQGGTGCTQNLDVMIIMDRSSSLTPDDFLETKNFVSATVAVLQNAGNDTRIGLATFSNSPTLVTGLTSNSVDVSNAIARMSNTTEGGTDITLALELANNQLTANPRADTARVVILLTDGGNANGMDAALLNASENLYLNNIQLVVVAVGNAVPVSDLQQLNPVSILEVDQATQLDTILGNLTDETCVNAVATSNAIGASGTNLGSTATLPESGNDDGGLPILPLGLGALALLLLLAGLFALMRRKKPTEIFVDPTPSQAQAMGAARHDYTRWLERLYARTMPGPSQSFAKFHTKTLVVGIGNRGADVLTQVIERIDDTNTQSHVYYAPHSRGYAAEVNAQRQLAMLHIDMPNVTTEDERSRTVQSTERWRQAMVDRLSITNRPDDRDPSEAQRQWSSLMDARSTQATNRQTAKLTLFNAFRLGRNGAVEIFAKLENYLNAGFKDIILVASPYDMVGANVLGDVAALLRAVKPERTDLNIYAFVPLDDDDQNQVLRYNQKVLRTAALHELGRLSTPAGIEQETSLGPGISYTVPERDAMVDAMVVFSGENCNLRLGNMLWGILVSPALFKEVTQRTRNIDAKDEYVPSTGISITRSITRPIHLLREALVCKLMIELIGKGQFSRSKPSIAACSTEEINLALDQVRGDGYLAMIRLLEESPTCAPQNKDFVIRLRQVFERARSQYERDLMTYSNLITQYSRDNDSRITTYDPREWEMQSFPYEMRHEILDRVGFTARRSAADLERGLLVNMMIAPDRALDYHHRDELGEYINAIEDVVRPFIVNQLLADPTKESLNTLASPRFNTTATDWQEQYGKWVQEVSKMLQAQNLPDAFLFSFNTPPAWTQDPVVDLATNPEQDSTFAMQGSLYSRVPLKSFSDLATITNNQDLVHPTEAIVRDVFSKDLAALKEVPVPLQSALTRRVEFWRFYQTWRVAGRAEMATELELANGSFEAMLKQFYSRYDKNYANFRSKVAQYIASAEDSSVDTTSAAADFEDHAFDKYLMLAFDALAQGKTRYFPPDTLY